MVKCKYDGCETQPSFNKEGETKGLYCNQHKLDGMVDVKHLKCKYDGCNTRPSFGLPGNRANCCKEHKEIGMISHPKRQCEKNKCKEIALYGMGKARRCETHKDEFDINLIEKKCISCELYCILDSNNKCYECDPNIYNKVRLAKQDKVKR